MSSCRTRLKNLLGYIEEQAKNIEPSSFQLSSCNGLRYDRTELSGLPGVDLDIHEQGDHVWLRVARLSASAPPAMPDTPLRGAVHVSDDPDQAPRLDARALQALLEKLASAKPTAGRADYLTRARAAAEKHLEQYRLTWEDWAISERQRRKTIALYAALFATKQKMLSEETARPCELVWGIGIASWMLHDGEDQVPFQYPLLTQGLDIALDSKTMTLEVRPRDTEPRFEADAFVACQIAGAADVHHRAREQLREASAAPINPFEPNTYAALLQLAATNLHSKGVYDQTLRCLSDVPEPSEALVVSDAWLMFVRPRANNYLIEDLHRLAAQLEADCAIPPGPAALVTPASDEVTPFAELNFRGLSSRAAHQDNARELYFPLPYNQEQVTIVHQLEQADGVAVQGPPGTGKTHTIANIICHYLATGRRVLVTSRGEPALAVLQDKIPAEVRPLTVALLTNDREGMRQFQASLAAIQHQVSQLDPRITREQIATLLTTIDRTHAALSSVDQRIDQIALAQLSEYALDGDSLRAQQLAELVVDGATQYSWFDDTLSTDPPHAPPLTDAQALRLREARRRLAADLRYLNARLPSSDALMSTQDVAELHRVMLAILEIDGDIASGVLLPLAANTPEVLLRARGLVDRIADACELVSALEKQREPWPLELRARFWQEEFASERSALEALFDELDLIREARALTLQTPVEMPDNAVDDPKIRDAIARAAKTGKPFGLLALGASDAKRHIATVRVAGRIPASTEDWSAVQRHVALRERASAFVVRWNHLAVELPLPTLAGASESLRQLEQLGNTARKAHSLATEIDSALIEKAQTVFSNVPTTELLGSSEQLEATRLQLLRHLQREELLRATAERAVLRSACAGCTGAVVDELLSFVDHDLGDPQLSVEQVIERYTTLFAEVQRLEDLALELAVVRECAALFERAGAPLLAHRLCVVPAGEAGDDAAFPTAWRKAWQWAAIRQHLDEIEARAELVTLSTRRRALERGLAKQYRDVVGKAAWLATKQAATPKVLQALAGYATAIRRIGQGTGPNATRYRRDARDAMHDAAAAVPCWIMSHAKVSESMPANIGAFDLVIVDEASQSNLWALPAILRAGRILVVGDDKQVSPDSGFIASDYIQSLRQRYLAEQPYQAEMTPEKSLYDLAARVFSARSVMLREHFRCAPAIIAYSNRTFYEDQIQPLRIPTCAERLDPPLVDIFVEDGQRDALDCNRQEADVICAEIAAILADEQYDGRTLGVVSLLGVEQAKYIDQLVLQRCDAAELIRRDFKCGDARTFQGNERDIMFISMVVDRAACKALSGLMFEQRFNVAASRARDRMYLVRSVDTSDLSNKDLRQTLLAHFSQPLAVSNQSYESLVERCESGFEREVFTALTQRGYRVIPRVHSGVYQIDMVVEGLGDTRLAIECDGDEVHGPERWPQDMARQRVLERAGWTFWRCFASAWVLHKDDVLAELVARLGELEISPLGAMQEARVLVEKRVVRSCEQQAPTADAPSEASIRES